MKKFIISILVIVCLSVTVFAADEQPSGSSYWYFNNSSTHGTGTYWNASSQSLYYIGTLLKNSLPSGSSYSYFTSSTSSFDDFWKAVTKSLVNIGSYIKSSDTTLTSILSDTASMESNISTISSNLPSGNSFAYFNISDDSTSHGTFWSANNAMLRYIGSRINSTYTNVQGFDTYLSNIDSSTSSVYSFLSATGRMPNGSNYPYLTTTGTQSSSNTNWWTALNSNTKNTGLRLENMSVNLTSYLSPAIDVAYKYFTSSGVESTNNYSWWVAMAQSTKNTGLAIESFRTTNHTDLSNIYNKIALIEQDTEDLRYVLADDEDKALKDAQYNNTAQASSDFLSGTDSSTSVGVTQMGKVKEWGRGFNDFFGSSPIGSQNIFTTISSPGWSPWQWFSNSTKYDLDPSLNSRSSQVDTISRDDYYRLLNSRSNWEEYGDCIVDFYSAQMDDIEYYIKEAQIDDSTDR